MWRLSNFLLLLCLNPLIQCQAQLIDIFNQSEFILEQSVSFELSTRLKGGHQITSQQNSYRLQTSLENYHSAVALDVSLRYDSVYDLHEHYGDFAQKEYKNTYWVNEAYYRWMGNNTDITLGYQKVVWGQADELRVVDVVNPLDLKNFILLDLDEYRLSQPMILIEHLAGQWELSALWILDFKPNNLPARGSEFDLDLPFVSDKTVPKGSEYGLRAYRLIKGMDVSFYYFEGYNDLPNFFLFDGRLTSNFRREKLLGISGALPIADFVFRYEYAHIFNKTFDTMGLNPVDKPFSQYLLGADYLYRNWLFTAQYMDHHVGDYDLNLLANKTEPLFTLFSEGSFISNKLKVRLGASFGDFDGQGGLYQLKLTYQPNYQWAYDFNLDVFSGNENNFFGQFKDNDRAYFSLTYML